MAKSGYIGVNGVARKVSKIYVGVNDVARNVTAGYVGINDTARQWFSSMPAWTAVDAPLAVSTSTIGVGQIAFNNGVFAASTNSTSPLITSTDGVTWTIANASFSTYGGIVWVTGGGGYLAGIAPSSNVIARSVDGVTWTPVTLGLSGSWTTFTHANYGGSTNFWHWNPDTGSGYYSNNLSTTATNSTISSITLKKIVNNGTRSLALGNAGAVSYSTNGTAWTATSGTGLSVPLTIGVYGDAGWVVGGRSSGLATSLNGISNWTNIYPIGGFVGSRYDIAYGDGWYCLVGSGQYAAVSQDAVTWKLTLLPSAGWGAVAYGDGKFVAKKYSSTQTGGMAYIETSSL